MKPILILCLIALCGCNKYEFKVFPQAGLAQYRIVSNPDGTFKIQRFSKYHKQWVMAGDRGFYTLKEACEMKRAFENPPAEPQEQFATTQDETNVVNCTP